MSSHTCNIPDVFFSPRCFFLAATFPDELGTSVPLVEEEQKELLYVPLDGEWGCRTRSDECERIIKAIDQLCTLGTTSPVEGKTKKKGGGGGRSEDASLLDDRVSAKLWRRKE